MKLIFKGELHLFLYLQTRSRDDSGSLHLNMASVEVETYRNDVRLLYC